MKKTGIVIVVIGLIITVFAGFNFVTKEKVVDIGNLQITAERNHVLSWSPFIGLALMVLGVTLYFVKSKK